ncbi:MAG: O-antigen ligase family protein, partial [Anaerolineae bacterium]
MGSRIGNYAARFIETGWLAAVMVVPLFFDVWSNRVFEPDKLTTLRSIAVLMVAAALVVWGQSGLPRPTAARLRAAARTPLVAPVLAMTAALAFSTALSRLPAQSIWGSYNRLQGLYTWSAYVVVFGAIVWFLRDRAQLERLVLAIILPSLPIALYAVVQRFGQDPMPWLGNVTRRVASTMGNSIFVAAYLIMVVPLTWVRLVQAYRRLEEDESTAAVLRLAGYIVMAVVQLLAIVLSQSRGPFLGLMAGLAITLILLLGTHRKALRGLLAAGVVVAAFLVAFNVPGSPLAPLRSVPYLGRLGQILETDSGTGKVRVLIWGGAYELFKSDPVRMVIGHGPETMHIVYNPFYPAELGALESRNASPDRSHNETWDTLVQAGLIGLLASLFLWASVFYVALRSLGLIEGAADRNRFLALWFGGGGALAAAFVALKGPPWFGVAMPLGMIVGLGLYLVHRVVLIGWTPPDNPTRRLVLIGVLGGIVA